MIIPPIRIDSWGSGEYLAPRSKEVNGERISYQHEGVDFAAYPKSILKSPVKGIIERIGYPYDPRGDRNEYRLIVIRVDDQTKIKIMYLYPTVIPREQVLPGTQLGVVQDISKHYEGMINHYHFEVIVEGQHVNPIQWLENYDRYSALNSSYRRD